MTASDGRQYLAARLASAAYGWTYVSLIPAAQFYAVAHSLRNINIALVVLSALAGLLVTVYASRRSFRQIEGVLDIVEAAERGAPLPGAPPKTDKGFSHVTYDILRMFLERRYLQVQLSERKYRQRTLELLALQSQMNPHFLFNTLETINWKVIELARAPSQVNEMIKSLSNVVKYALESPFADETLRNEIEHARDYLSIQSIREATGPRHIGIAISEAEEKLRITVEDDELGMAPERLAELRARLAGPGDDLEPGRRSIGLANTNKRLKLAFGDEYGLSLQSSPGQGTTVIVELPSRGERESPQRESRDSRLAAHSLYSPP